MAEVTFGKLAATLGQEGRWIAARVYATLSANYILRANSDRPQAIEAAVNRAAFEALHVARGFDAHFAVTIETTATAAQPSGTAASAEPVLTGYAQPFLDPTGTVPPPPPLPPSPKPANAANGAPTT